MANKMGANNGQIITFEPTNHKIMNNISLCVGNWENHIWCHFLDSMSRSHIIRSIQSQISSENGTASQSLIYLYFLFCSGNKIWKQIQILWKNSVCLRTACWIRGYIYVLIYIFIFIKATFVKIFTQSPTIEFTHLCSCAIHNLILSLISPGSTLFTF